MNKKIFLLILIPALLLIGAYAYIRYSLKTAITRDGEKIATVTKPADSSALLDLRPLTCSFAQCGCTYFHYPKGQCNLW